VTPAGRARHSCISAGALRDKPLSYRRSGLEAVIADGDHVYAARPPNAHGLDAWGVSRRLVAELRERATAMCDGVENVRGVVWLEPSATVDVQYSEPMQGRLRDPVYCGHG